MTCKYSETNQHDALYMVARAYPGGVEAMAARMGKTVPVMYNKLRPGIATHHVSFEEVSEIIEHCQQAGVKDALAPAQAFAWRLGAVLVPLPAAGDAGDETLARGVCKTMKELGDVASSIHDALANDNAISQDEFDRFEKEFQEAAAALFELRSLVRERAAGGRS